MRQPTRPLIIAHRGDSAHAPENTLAAFQAARTAGADWIELDVQMTEDGSIICLHDYTLERTTNVRSVFPAPSSFAAPETRWEEARRLDAGSWFGGKYAGEPIALLSEALRDARGGDRPLGVLVEVKDTPLYGERTETL